MLLWNVVRLGGGSWALLILHRKYMCPCALLTRAAVFTDQVSLSVHPQEHGAAEHLHHRVVDEKWDVAGLELSEVNNDLLCFGPIQDKAAPAPAHCSISFVSQVVVIPGETHHCCVVCKLHNVVCHISGDAVMCHQSEQQRAQDTARRGPRAEGDDTEGVLSDTLWRWRPQWSRLTGRQTERVKHGREFGDDVLPYQTLEALHHDGSQCDWPVVTMELELVDVFFGTRIMVADLKHVAEVQWLGPVKC